MYMDAFERAGVFEKRRVRERLGENSVCVCGCVQERLEEYYTATNENQS
jgi:hypothetical protein